MTAVLVDANILVLAVDESARRHSHAAHWLTKALNGDALVALPWQSIAAFLRIVTSPKFAARPLSATAAWEHVQSWLDADPAWIPPVSDRTTRIFGDLIARLQIDDSLVSDAQLAALAMEHGLMVATSDHDFARFPEIRWVNPIGP